MSASINVNTTNVMFRNFLLFEALKQGIRTTVIKGRIHRTIPPNRTFIHEKLIQNRGTKCRPWNHKFVQESRRQKMDFSITSVRVSSTDSSFFKYRGLLINQLNLKNLSQCRSVHTSRIMCHEARKCWKCGKEMDNPAELFLCECGIVQKPASNLTYFQLFGLEADFDVDLKPLSEKYKELQKQLHPDKFTQASETEKSHAADQSSLVNKAYSVLTKPLHRAIYMLEIHNHPIEESSSISDPEFLMEIMELNEELADVESPDELKAIEEQNDNHIDHCIKDISSCFKSKNIISAHDLVIKLQYYTNITDKIKDLKRSWIK